MKLQSYLYVNALSSLGSRMDLIACSALIFTFEHSAYWLTAFFVMRQVGGMVFSPFAGMLADRLDRRKAMIISDLGSGIAVLAILFFPNPYLLIAAVFLKGMLYTMFHISFQASLPQMFGSEQLVKINGLTVRLESVVGIAGFGLGGFLTDHFSYSFVIACHAACFLFSAWMLTRIRWESDPETSIDAPGQKVARNAGLWPTLLYVKRHPVLFAVSLLALFASFGTASHNYGLPFLAERLSAGDATLHGFMWSAMSVGALCGSFVATRLRVQLAGGMFAASFLTAVVIALAFAFDHSWSVLLLLSGAGLFAGAASVYESTILQQADNQIRGRVLGLQGLLSRTGFFLGFVVAPQLAASLTLFGLILLAQAVLVVGIVGLGCYVKSGKQ